MLSENGSHPMECGECFSMREEQVLPKDGFVLATSIERGIGAAIANRSRLGPARANRQDLSSAFQARQYPSKLRDVHHGASVGYFPATGRDVLIGESKAYIHPIRLKAI